MKSFKETVEILYDDMLEKRAVMSDWAKRSLGGAGIGALGGGILGATAADEGHGGAGFLSGATVGAGLGALLPYAHEMTPMANAQRKLKEMSRQHGYDIEKLNLQSAASKELENLRHNLQMQRAGGVNAVEAEKLKQELQFQHAQKLKDLEHQLQMQRAGDLTTPELEILKDALRKTNP